MIDVHAKSAAIVNYQLSMIDVHAKSAAIVNYQLSIINYQITPFSEFSRNWMIFCISGLSGTCSLI